MTEQVISQINTKEWDRRASSVGLHAVFSRRWSEEEADIVNMRQQELIFSLLPCLKEKTVLDLGCGIGRLTKSLSKRAKFIIGSDISLSMLQRAQKEAGSKNTHFIQASAGYLPFDSERFDVVLASYVLQHILDDNLFRLAIKEIARIICKEGILLLVDGISKHYCRPTNSNITVLRTWEQYTKFLSPYFKLEVKEDLPCVDDDYIVTLWKKQK